MRMCKKSCWLAKGLTHLSQIKVYVNSSNVHQRVMTTHSYTSVNTSTQQLQHFYSKENKQLIKLVWYTSGREIKRPMANTLPKL